MTKAGNVTWYRWRETVRGEIPDTLTATQLRYTGDDNLHAIPQLQDSPEITAGDEPQDLVQTGTEGSGNLNIAFSPRNWDEFFEELYGNTFGAAGTSVRDSGTAQVTYVASTRTLTTSGTWTNTPAAGDKILVQGSGNAYLDGIHTVDPASTPNSTTIVLEQDGILSDATKVPNIATARNITIIRGARLTNSVTPAILSAGFEKRITRVRGTYLGVTASQGTPSTDFKQVLGIIPTRIQLQATGEAPWTGQIALRCSSELNSSTATTPAGATVIDTANPYVNSPIFQGVDSVKKCRFYVPGLVAGSSDAVKLQNTMRICPQSMSLEFQNSLQATPLMCAKSELDFQHGEPIGQANVVGIYETPLPVEAFNRQLSGVFEVALVATNGEGYLIRFPRAKMTLVTVNTPGRGTTVVANMTVKAFRQVDTPVAGDSARAIEIYRFRQGA